MEQKLKDMFDRVDKLIAEKQKLYEQIDQIDERLDDLYTTIAAYANIAYVK